MRTFPTGEIDVLLASYGAGHVAMLRPVYLQLREQGLRVAYLALTTAQADLERHGINYFGYAELDGANDPEVQAWGQELVGPSSAHSAVPHFESVAYHGLNFRDLVREYGEASARQKYDENDRQSFSPVATMEALLKRLQPRVVVATNSPRSERALLEAARNLDIPSLCAVDLFGLQEAKWISSNKYATRICVLNQKVAEFFVSQGCDPASIAVTGNPAFDTINSHETREAGSVLRKDRGFTKDDRVILFASNVEPSHHPFNGKPGDPTLPRKIEAKLREIVAEDERLHLIVRYHPSEDVEFMPAAKVSLSPRQEHLKTLIKAVDVVVVIVSTVGLEAHLAGKPVISVEMSVFSPDSPYASMGVSTAVADLAELPAAISGTTKVGAKPSRLKNPPTACSLICTEITHMMS